MLPMKIRGVEETESFKKNLELLFFCCLVTFKIDMIIITTYIVHYEICYYLYNYAGLIYVGSI